MHLITTKIQNKIIELKKKNVSEDTIRVIVKEILQDYVLAAIYSSDIYSNLVFIGGTALRKLYNLNRFSEDLDFNTNVPINYTKLGNYILKYFRNLNLEIVDYSIQESKEISRLTLKFRILKDIGLSAFQEEKLHIKVETTQSKIYKTELFSLNISNTPVVIRSYSLPILMSGKILACLERVFEKGATGIKFKGRDYYDLIWYMQNNVNPDPEVLLDSNNEYSITNVFSKLDKNVELIKEKDLYIDLRTFFEDSKSIKIWCKNFHELYNKYRNNYS